MNKLVEWEAYMDIGFNITNATAEVWKEIKDGTFPQGEYVLLPGGILAKKQEQS